MLYVLTFHVVVALLAPTVMRRFGRRGFTALALAPASTAAYAAAIAAPVLAGRQVVSSVRWVPTLDLSLTFRIDTLSWVMLLIVGAVGALVLVYCAGYFSPKAAGNGRFGAVFVAFAGAMAGLVAADNTLVMFTFWELTTVFSYLLIGHYSDRKPSRRAAMQAIVVTTAGGLTMLVGLILFGESVAGGYSFQTLIAGHPHTSVTTAALVCVIVGAASKSALIPMHFWLPAAMAAPTPVSSYLHAAAMVKAGVYLLARFAPGYSDNRTWLILTLTLGSATFLLGGYRALRQHDLKLILAYGTVSQLGLLVLLLSAGSRAAALAGLALLCAHAMFKATLFLTTGAIDVAAGSRDLRRLTGVGKRVPVLAVAAGIAIASMAGVIPTAGYVAKEAAMDSFAHGGVAAGGAVAGWLLFAVVVAGSILTVAYGLRFWWGAFASKPEGAGRAAQAADPDEDLSCIDPATIKKPGALLVIPPAILAAASLLVGLLPHVTERILGPYANSYPAGDGGHLTLWGGLTPALFGSIAALGVGALLFAARAPIEAFQRRIGSPVEADYIYRRFMRKLDDFAADTTAFTQRGSLPFYLGVIFSVFALAGGFALARSQGIGRVRLFDSFAQIMPVVVICIAVVLVVRSRRRLKAVLLAGFGGYAVAALFILHGAPDLALTQVLVETITLVVFVLVLRKLPPYFSDRPLARSRWSRLGIAVAVGVVAMGLALVAPGARVDLPVSSGIADQIYSYGGGKNIVNVILVDTRAWDTMGEISVLLAAATGIASLVFLRRRTSQIERVEDLSGPASNVNVWGGAGVNDNAAALRRQDAATTRVPAGSKPAWLRAVPTLAPLRRSLIFEVVTRIVFHPLVVFAAFLLFSGHNNPGGGFAAGLVVGIALVIRYLAGGRYELSDALPVQPGLLLGSGLVLSVGTGLVALVTGNSMLQSVIWHLTVPLVGDVKIVSSLFFDVGVFLVVVGLVLDILRSLGAEIDKQGEVRS
ncbi:multisubunit sodium/proton antiporter MrpA subunit /multisubunit sodium/proton antiporter MrpB subunit [Rarobacter incanus]|uniref:Multisubunit sodium/proton antiporter MrpA subunit /multisubunit sodium/proton antiporter MrpB subunit n=1 Tax=Rarobacter incanus TaxID=153494 RepID=A0A542SRE6_9MICO|nr:multisubunit sodium/proton antiporter MrpA subunit /multisubunit sodium/proton antiporter MrpB subunit [Rarobacter incanus]